MRKKTVLFYRDFAGFTGGHLKGIITSIYNPVRIIAQKFFLPNKVAG